MWGKWTGPIFERRCWHSNPGRDLSITTTAPHKSSKRHILFLFILLLRWCGVDVRWYTPPIDIARSYTFSNDSPFSFNITWQSIQCFVTPRIHFAFLRPPPIYFFCVFFNANVSTPYISAGLITVLYTFTLIFTFIFLSHNTPDTLFQFLLCKKST